MKKSIIYIACLMAMIIGVSSCEDFLNPRAESDLREKDFYKNDKDLDQALISCYNGLQAPMNAEWSLTELRSDNTRLNLSSSTSTTSRELNAADIFRVETTNSYNTDYWKKTYHNIYNCNTVLAHLDVTSPEMTKQFMGEALFIRAYHYFNLVRLYGPVFLVKEPISGDKANNLSRSSTAEVYTMIETDLRKAIDSLPIKYADTQKGRVTKTAAKTLLAKVYLTLKRFEDAKVLLLEAKDDTNYGFAATYPEIFSIDNEMNPEIIFAVRYKAGNKGIGAPFANYFAPNNSFDRVVNGSGSGYNFPTIDLIKSYEPGDTRKNVSLIETWTAENGQVFYSQYVNKYMSKVVVKEDAENDWPVLRYTDVLMMLAEVMNEADERTTALPLINKVRVRAGLSPIDINDVNTYTDFKLVLEKERRIEFAFENQRYYDLLRTDRLIPVMDAHFQSEVEKNSTSQSLTSYYRGDKTKITYLPVTLLQQWQTLLPIPFEVMNVSPNATQNYGY